MANGLMMACGVYNLLLAAFHLAFWRLFGWRRDLARLQPYNRGIMQILNLRLTHVFVVFGLACLLYGAALYATPLGRFLLAGMALFWLGRTIEQFVFLRLRHWAVNALTVMFALGALLHALPLFVSAR